ncbi:CapA family protein [Litorilinea aerophila]|uniref:CapA family protein n=1 Tax=Litorilinea aerophila TaxID=1204385 RepID=A0A540VK82_9CHLR|nr:CapA family protein [Litorilinea aerophila]MCC9075263.1 CapA family protein [Litorilinea aerophila]
MSNTSLARKLTVLASALMILAGIALAIWSLTHIPHTPGNRPVQAAAGPGDDGLAALLAPRATPTATPPASSPPATVAREGTPIVLVLDPALPPTVRSAVDQVVSGYVNVLTTTVPADTPSVTLSLEPEASDGTAGRPIYRLFFAAATRFDVVEPDITWAELEAAWQGEDERFQAVAVLTQTIPALSQILAGPGPTVQGYATVEQLREATWGSTPTLALLPFELLEPRLAVLAVDGQNPVENAHHFDPEAYPLVATVYAHIHPVTPAQGRAIDALFAQMAPANRDPDRLTVVAMTGVTAMTRLTAAQMDRYGYDWPAAIVGPELASADITAISNEVPFVPGCETNTDLDNLVFCSKPEYMEALTASGVDIVGLTGNHQNDYGVEAALQSLAIYAEAGLPVYGGGENREAAFAPLYIEHNGNRLAFLGANSYGPPSAWATDSRPGSAPFDLNIMSATIRNIKEQGRADVVFAELQYQESYDVQPLWEQRQDFSALVRAGADVVTGVQSHVPQAIQFLNGRLILYGLGNLFFDQMWSETTRQGLIVKHTIYQGRHISTRLLPTVLEDYGQPRWATPEEREVILQRVFTASGW